MTDTNPPDLEMRNIPGALRMKDADLLRSACYVAGEWIGAENGETFEVTNPADGQVIANVPSLGAKDVAKAIAAAVDAQRAWRKQPGKARATILRDWYSRVMAAIDDLARLNTLEQGKPLAEARAEVLYAASFIEWFAEEAKRIDGDVLASPTAGNRILVLKEPVGVCAAITPWNLPYAMVTRKVAPALAAGCAIVLKPAEQTPLTAFALAVLAERAGVPKGLFSVVTGAPAVIGGALMASTDIRKISFTGSTEIGKLLTRQSAETLKRVSLELGGNAPVLVFDDADLDTAVNGIMQAKFRFSGQACIAANRIYVQSGIYPRVAEELAKRIGALKVGPGSSDVDIGPLIDMDAVNKARMHVEDAIAGGARVLAGGQPMQGMASPNYFAPTLLAEVTSAMLITQEETFGPVAPLIRFDTLDEVLQAANETPYGLAAYVFSQNMRNTFGAIEGLEVGMIGVNTGLISNEVGPFGGVKESGTGREGSKYGLDEYLEKKYVNLAGL